MFEPNPFDHLIIAGPLNYPIRLNDKLAGVGDSAATGSFAPTAQQVAVRDELVVQIAAELAKLKVIWTRIYRSSTNC